MNKLNNILVDTQMISVAITDRDIETYGKSLYTWYSRTFDSKDLYIVCTSVTNSGFLGHIVPSDCLDEAIEVLAQVHDKVDEDLVELYHHQTRNLEQIILTWSN